MILDYIAYILYFIGIWGIYLNRKNLLIVIMSIELMLLAINLYFLIQATTIDDFIGLYFSIIILTLAAAESAIGLALLVIYYKRKGSITILI